MKRWLIIVSLLLWTGHCLAKGSTPEQKNQKIVAKEEARFEKDLRKTSDSANAYLTHANNLAAISSEANRASDYYLLAIKYDSANAGIFKSYGRYLFEVLRKYPDARKILKSSLEIKADDAEVQAWLVALNNILAAQDADNKLRDFGSAGVTGHDTAVNYASSVNFDSLRALAVVPGGRFSYKTLINRFLSDDSTLTAEDMYMLIVGYSTQPGYNPFSYNDILEMKMISGHNLDSAINKGNRIISDNPLNPTLNKELMYYYRKKNDVLMADKYRNRVHLFFNGVLYSGNGTCSKPYVSLWSKEEYNFITFVGHTATENHYMGQCAGHMAEIIDIDPGANAASMHFNVALIYMQAVGK